MEFRLKTIARPGTERSQCLVVPLFGSGAGSAEQALDDSCGGLIGRLRKRGDAPAENGETLLLPAPPEIRAERLLLLGTGKAPLSAADFGKLARSLFKRLDELKLKDACLLLDELEVVDRHSDWQLTQLSLAAQLSSYRYRDTLSKPKPPATLKRITLAGRNTDASRQALARGSAIGTGMNRARRLGDLPGNHCTPSTLAREARALGRRHQKLSVSVLEEKKMRELGMGALLSVTAGTEQPAKFIVMEYRGTRRDVRPQVLVGKGITFDSGGISLKPGAKMDEMKYDMCGAASVMGTMETVTELGLPINVVAIIAAAENLPSGRASKPGDVVTSLSGQTIEILNTDAEGRLVLCDALTYAARYKPAAIIDIATLTGACVVALGKHASAVYANQDDLAGELLEAGERIGDRGWHMPLWEDYQEQIDSRFADMANVGGPEAGSITAACFLSRFTREMRWAHLDIAGTAWNSGGAKGATGRPVALLSQYLIERSA